MRDKYHLVCCLKSVGYYRLSAYLYPFRVREGGQVIDDFALNTSFDKVWAHYRFDRNLRLLLMDAVERVEVALRVQLAHLHTKSNSPFDYARESYFPDWKEYPSKIRLFERPKDMDRGEPFVKQFFAKYGDSHTHLPLWMAVGISDFGFMSFFFARSPSSIRTAVASEWGMTSRVLKSWLVAINSLRNACAHHSRVWNKPWGIAPEIPNYSTDKRWYLEYNVDSNCWQAPKKGELIQPSFPVTSTATLLFVCRHLLRSIAPDSQWHKRVENHFETFARSEINFVAMGLPQNWMWHPLWK